MFHVLLNPWIVLSTLYCVVRKPLCFRLNKLAALFVLGSLVLVNNTNCVLCYCFDILINFISELTEIEINYITGFNIIVLQHT